MTRGTSEWVQILFIFSPELLYEYFGPERCFFEPWKAVSRSVYARAMSPHSKSRKVFVVVFCCFYFQNYKWVRSKFCFAFSNHRAGGVHILVPDLRRTPFNSRRHPEVLRSQTSSKFPDVLHPQINPKEGFAGNRSQEGLLCSKKGSGMCV